MRKIQLGLVRIVAGFALGVPGFAPESNPKRALGVSRAAIGLLVFPILLAASLALAKDGRDFAGFYELGEITDLGEVVRVPLKVRVFNYSGADVNDATITLEDLVLPGQTYGSFIAPVYVQDSESVRLSDQFTIPRREYEHWQEGGTPSLIIDYMNANGNTIQRPIELFRMALGEEE